MTPTNNLDRLDLTSLAMQFHQLRIHKDPKLLVAAADDFAKLNKLHLKSWFIPQALARLNELQLSRVNDKIDAKELLRQIMDYPDKLAIWMLFVFATRGSILASPQTVVTRRDYCTLTPLVMYAFKLYRNVAYSAWDRSTISSVVAPALVEAMLFDKVVEVTPELQEEALTYKTGAKAGTKELSTNYKLTLPLSYRQLDMPKLAGYMYLQTWCAHPTIRSSAMILDPLDWDNMPKPLVPVDIEDKAQHNISDLWFL